MGMAFELSFRLLTMNSKVLHDSSPMCSFTFDAAERGKERIAPESAWIRNKKLL